MSQVQSVIAPSGTAVSTEQIQELVAHACPAKDYAGRRVLLVVPDSTRTAPIGPFFRALHRQIAASAAAFDVMVALGTHPPMSEEAICRRLEITPAERAADFGSVRLLNHEWDNPAALRTLGSIPAAPLAPRRINTPRSPAPGAKP